MADKPIVKKFQFSKEEHDKLQNIHFGIVASQAQLDGMQIYKNVILDKVYKRVGIETENNKEWLQTVTYNLAENELTYTKTPVKKGRKC